MNIKETKKLIIQAGHRAVEELINVAREKIITNTEDDVSADRLKNAAATKKLAIFDAFEILNRIQEEENLLEGKTPEKTEKKAFKGFAESRSR
tara:strand:+ start:545 stop:823 length:279 start_codon:yes stop_codon:yes gene_type:complete